MADIATRNYAGSDVSSHQTSNNVPPGNYIESITCENIFGELSFALELEAGLLPPDPRVLILYGENGSGKTTLLKLIRSLLSPELSGGHRTYLAGIPFSRVSVRLTSGITVEAIREKTDQLRGSFRYRISSKNINPFEFIVPVRADGTVRYSEWDPENVSAYSNLLKHLSAATPRIIYLDDQRIHFETPSSSKSLERKQSLEIQKSLKKAEPEADPVYLIVQQMFEIVRREAFIRSNRGSLNVQNIYSALLESLIGVPKHDDIKATVINLHTQLEQIQKRSTLLAGYGLAAPLDNTGLLKSLSRAETLNRSEVVVDVLKPYVESTAARFDILDTLKEAIDKLLFHLNDFLGGGKRASFSLSDGLEFESRSSRSLSIANMSSGERHLTLLLAHAVIARMHGGILIIDEPEISLNVSWQRKLVGALLDCAGAGAVQLVFASHSLEIISQFSSNVITLPDHNP